MEIKQGTMEKLRDKWEVFSIRLRRSQSKLYFLWFIEMILFYLLMFGLRLAIDTTPTYLSTAIGNELTFGSAKFELLESQVDFDARKLSVFLGNASMEGPSDIYKWKVTLEYLNGSESQAKVTTKTGDNHFLYLHVDDLPSEWQVVKMTIMMSAGTAINSQQLLISRQDTTSQKVVDLSQREIENTSINYSIVQRDEAIESLKKETKGYKKVIIKAEKHIERLTSELEFQTEKQQIETEGQVKQLESTIASLNQSIVAQAGEIEEYRLQIEKLELKLAALDN